MVEQDRTMGPVGYLAVEFPRGARTGEGLPVLVDLARQGLIRVLDLVFAHRRDDGSIEVLELKDLDADGTLDLAVFEGAASGLLDTSDVEGVGSMLEPGSSVALLLYENCWALPLVNALLGSNARLAAAGFVPFDELEEVLEASEPATVR